MLVIIITITTTTTSALNSRSYTAILQAYTKEQASKKGTLQCKDFNQTQQPQLTARV